MDPDVGVEFVGRRDDATSEGEDRIQATHVEDEGDATTAQRGEAHRVRVVDARGPNPLGSRLHRGHQTPTAGE